MRSSSLACPAQPFPFQLEGVAFLYPRHAAVLADEMGLGKTVQAILAARLLLHSGEVSTVLLVCPKPLVANWVREFGRWAPEVPVGVIEGDQARRDWLWNRADVPVMVANYELLTRDREILVDRSLRFDLVILDESQRIKNRGSATAQVACSLSRTRSWALTGTPVENSADDLVGIFDFACPGYLSTEMKLSRMGSLAREYVLRRTKEQVLSHLPPKLYRDADLELGPSQRASYDLAEKEGVIRLSEMGRHVAIRHVFELILRLKQICNFDPATGESTKLERLEADLEEVAASGQKAIVFSQWVDSLRFLADRLTRFGPLPYHGRIPPAQREAVLRRFRDDRDCHVLLMSYGAGGVGLNLQFAGYVFLFDRWWNPAVEDQAVNRAHRIGVHGPVTVTRFLTQDTIEQRINEILESKRAIFESLFSRNDPHSTRGLSHEELFGLFELRVPSAQEFRAV
jgi:SNF2 family DNA or RNA helicase